MLIELAACAVSGYLGTIIQDIRKLRADRKEEQKIIDEWEKLQQEKKQCHATK